MPTRWNILKSSPRGTKGGRPEPALSAPVISWPHVRDSLLLLAAEIGVDLGFHYSEQLLPITPGLLREPQRVLHWFIVATVCWFCADPLLRLLNNSRKGLAGSRESLISMGIQQGDEDEEEPKSNL